MVVILILVLGLFLRLVNLNQSLWLDEAVQAITATSSFSYTFSELIGDFHPPLFHLLLHFWVRVFGDSEISLRMPAVLFGTATIFVVYKIAKLLKPGKLGEIVALFLAVAPYHIYYSQEARMYAASTFFATGSMYFFLKKIIQKKRLSDFIFYFIFTLCLIYTDYYGFFILLIQTAYLLIKKKYKLTYTLLFLFLLCYLPWVSGFIAQIKFGIQATKILPDWGKLVNLSFFKALPLTLAKFVMGRIGFFNKKVYALIFSATSFLYIYLILNGIKKNFQKKNNHLWLIILWLALPIMFSWMASLFIPNYQPFRLLLVLPAFYLLLALGAESINSKKIRVSAVFSILIVSLVFLSIYYFNPYFQREDWKGLSIFLKNEKNALVVLPSIVSNWPLRYYDKNNEISLAYGVISLGKTDKNVLPGDQKNLDVDQKVYYIRYLVPLFDPQANIEAKLSQLGYNKTREISFNQIPVWEYEKAK